MDSQTAKHGQPAVDVNDVQVRVREMIYPGEEMSPRPDLPPAGVEAITKVRELLVGASTRLDRTEHPDPDTDAALPLLREARERLEELDDARLPDDVVSLRDAAVRGIDEIVERQS